MMPSSTVSIFPKKRIRKFAFLLLLLSISGLSFGQKKYEKETRIKRTAVPEQALQFVDTLDFNKKIKWYREIGLNRTTIEAKTKYLGKKYSIEFTPEGVLEDVEIKIKWATIPLATQDKITTQLTTNYGKYGIDKIQIQYVGNDQTVWTPLNRGERAAGVTVNYELVIHSKVDRSFKRFEYLFSKDGAFLKFAEIVLKNTDHIEY